MPGLATIEVSLRRRDDELMIEVISGNRTAAKFVICMSSTAIAAPPPLSKFTHRRPRSCNQTSVGIHNVGRGADGGKLVLAPRTDTYGGAAHLRLGADQGSRDTLLTRPHEPHQDARHW